MKQEKILEYFDRLPIRTLRSAWISRCRTENDNYAKLEEGLLADGFERVDVTGQITDDGREVLHIRNRAYALRPEIHAKRLASALARAQDKKEQHVAETKSVVGTESLSAMLCPKCGDTLQHTKVCPACAAGKIGYRHRYTCVCGGVDMVSKEAL